MYGTLPSIRILTTLLFYLAGLRCRVCAPSHTIQMQDFVTEVMGTRFIQPPPFDLAKCYADSHVGSPLIFVLSTGSDPTKAFYNFAQQVRCMLCAGVVWCLWGVRYCSLRTEQPVLCSTLCGVWGPWHAGLGFPQT